MLSQTYTLLQRLIFPIADLSIIHIRQLNSKTVFQKIPNLFFRFKKKKNFFEKISQFLLNTALVSSIKRKIIKIKI